MQAKFNSLIRKVDFFLKKLGNIVHGENKTPELNILIPGENYQKLRSRYYSYKNLLLKNNELLNTLSEIEEEIRSKTITPQSFRSYLAHIFDNAFGFIQSLNDMSDNRYIYLYDVLERIRLNTEALLKEEPEEEIGHFIIPIEKITAKHFKDTGSKASNLGEIRNIIKLPTPHGFSITVRAYKDFMSLNNLEAKINELTESLDIKNTDKIDAVSKEIQKLIIKSPVPSHIVERISKEADKFGNEETFSVRSSAVGEDGKFSFAGQFKSILNIKREFLIDAYKNVLASTYSKRAIFYRIAKGIKNKEIPMAVLVLKMINVRAAGVLYTLNPGQPERDEVIISAVWGQGQYAVSGTISPDVYVLDRRNKGKIINKTISNKYVQLVLDPSGGVKEVPVAEESRKTQCISNQEIKALYDFSSLIERHFKAPQDIEWAIDDHGLIQILQARPLHIKRVIKRFSSDIYHEKKIVLMEGDIASSGIAWGPVHIIESYNQISNLPEGAVLVAKRTSNEFTRIMPFVSAIIIETGSRTSHLATVAREFNIPMIINAGNITEMLRNETVVTVDATTGRIYRGRIDNLLSTEAEIIHSGESLFDKKIIRSVMKNITPLNLTNIDEVDIDSKEFQTIHDIIRYVHEVSVKEMFRIGELTEGESFTQQLVSDLIPMFFYIIDLDGGVIDEVKFLRKISPEHINSTPFRALWRGMTYEGVRWSGPVDIDMRGLASVMARSFVRTGVTEKGGKAYVIITDQYMNLSVKLAYHFSVIDAFCGESYINNYINFRFQGGGASVEGRRRRALFIKEVLESLDFGVEVKEDFVIANIKGASSEETENKLDMLGRLIGCSRQLDMAISSMKAKDWYVKAFLEGNYSFVHD